MEGRASYTKSHTLEALPLLWAGPYTVLHIGRFSQNYASLLISLLFVLSLHHS